MQSPKEEHMEVARCVLRYLKGRTGERIFLSAKNTLQLYGFCDFDWEACPLSRRSLTGYFINLG